MGGVGDRRLRRARRPRCRSRSATRSPPRAPMSSSTRPTAWTTRASTSRARERSPRRRSRAGARLVHLSSDIVFRGSPTRALTEEDEPDPVTAYGRSKLEAERLCPPDALLVRTSLIYGGPVPSSHERAALEVADGVRDMSLLHRRAALPDRRRRPRRRGPRAGGARHRRPPARGGRRRAHAPGVRAADLRAPRARPRRAARRARRPGAPQADRPGLLAGARPAARAPARRARGAVAVRAIVVGAGVVGLTTAVCLREAGIAADVVAREEPQDTTSAVAAALWYPYRALPQERVTAWSAATYEQLARLAGVAGSGVRMRAGTELLARRRARPVVARRGARAAAHGRGPALRGARRRHVRCTCPGSARGCARSGAPSSAITSPRSTSSTPTPWSTARAWARASWRATRR